MDGRTEVGLLEDGTQRYDPIALGSAAQLYIDGLVLAGRPDVAPAGGPELPGDVPATPDAPAEPPPVPAKPSPDPGEPGGASDPDAPQSAARIYRFERYYPGQRAFIPREIQRSSGELDSIDLLADFLVAAAADSGWTQMVVAHADASGSSGKNQEITDARAQSMRAVVVGDQEAWLDTIAADDQQVASRVLFHWIAARYGWDTDTSAQSGWNERCVAALTTYRAQVGEHLGCPVGSGDSMERVDWACAFEMIQDALVGSLRGNPETLAVLRGSLSIADSQVCGCGVRFEAEASEPTDAEAVRRVELVLLEDSRALAAARADANGLYDRERVEQTIIVHAPRVALRLRVRAAEGFPLGGVPYQLKVNGFRTSGQSSAEGMLNAPRVPLGEFAVELHDPVLLLAHDLAQRIHLAIENDVPAALLSLLSQTDEVAASLAKVYERLFGAALVDDVEHATAGTVAELVVAALLARCGLKPDDRFAFHYFDATREFP
ncbi:MAG: hypothetical protein JKY37_23850 [Nannocystaceae bacterium]|nr:hypothetical protein [Nannocystaceae bacterium]